MVGSKRIVLGVTDLKSLFQSIKSKYSIDYSNYALSSFKKRLEDFMEKYHIFKFDELVHKFETDSDFFQLFIAFHLVDSTEMFRDPEFWSELKTSILSKYSSPNEIKVLIPESNSGEEIYSFQIICSQLGLLKKVNIFVTTVFEPNKERILDGDQDSKKMEINVANFERFQEGVDLMDYFVKRINNSGFKPELMENVEVRTLDIVSEEIPGIYDFILFRNKMLYFNPQLKNEVLRKLDTVLKPGGYIAVGIKESVDHPSWENSYTLISESERIYKKKLA